MKANYHRALRDGTTVVEGERLHTFVASSPEVARDGMALRASGWYLERYRSNPVIMWAHDYRTRPPIGRAVDIDGDKDGLRATVRFDQADDFAREVERKYDDGFLNAVSVGWDWIRDGVNITFAEWLSTSDEELAAEWDYDLLEISSVPVPADPEALKDREAAGRDSLRSLGFVRAEELPVDLPAPPPPEAVPDPGRFALEIAQRRARLAGLR